MLAAYFSAGCFFWFYCFILFSFFSRYFHKINLHHQNFIYLIYLSILLFFVFNSPKKITLSKFLIIISTFLYFNILSFNLHSLKDLQISYLFLFTSIVFSYSLVCLCVCVFLCLFLGFFVSSCEYDGGGRGNIIT